MRRFFRGTLTLLLLGVAACSNAPDEEAQTITPAPTPPFQGTAPAPPLGPGAPTGQSCCASHGGVTLVQQCTGSQLLCNDGAPSPTCACGREDASGCCSSHGGIALGPLCVGGTAQCTDGTRSACTDCAR
jgi:hypothetical protein